MKKARSSSSQLIFQTKKRTAEVTSHLCVTVHSKENLSCRVVKGFRCVGTSYDTLVHF